MFICIMLFRQIKGNCAESFTEYWTCVDYTGNEELRHCRKQQYAFDNCVLDKLGWQRPDLGELSKVSLMKTLTVHSEQEEFHRWAVDWLLASELCSQQFFIFFIFTFYVVFKKTKTRHLLLSNLF